MRTTAAFAPAQVQAAPRPTRVVAGGRQKQMAAVGRPAVCAAQASSQQQQPPSLQQQQQQQPSSIGRQQQHSLAALSRRALLAATPAATLALALAPRQALAFVEPPPGFRYHNDKLDGYSFFYPQDWQLVTVYPALDKYGTIHSADGVRAGRVAGNPSTATNTKTSGNDVFYRNPFNVEENLFVDVSSPSSSRYDSVADLGSPQDAAQRTLDQYLEEFMSTRLGVKRSGEIVSARSRTGADGRLYYDVQARVRSYASRNQLAVTQAEVDEGVELEWDRIYLAVLGVANRRLYQFRLQSSVAAYERDAARLSGIAASFECREV